MRYDSYNRELMIVSVDSSDLSDRLDRIQVLSVQLAWSKDVAEQADICERLHREIANAKAVLTLYTENDEQS